MKKSLLTTFGLSVIFTACLASTSSAAYTSWSNNTDFTYWKPYWGSFVANKDATYPRINASLSFYWNSTQVQKLKQSISRYPTFDVRDHSQSSFSGTYISSTLPDPKYDYEDDNGDGRNEELEVVLRDHWSVTTQNYSVQTVWAVNNTLNSPKLTSYSCVSDQPFYPGGDYNTVYGTSEFLAQLYWSDINIGYVSASDAFAQNADSRQASNETLRVADDTSKVDHEYEILKSNTELQNYKMKVHQVLSNANDEQSFDYIMTFNKPISLEKLRKFMNHLEVGELYAHGKNETGDLVTIGTNKINFTILNQLVTDDSYQFNGFTEIEGTASAKELKKYLNDDDVFSVEIATEHLRPKGLGWKVATLK